MLAAVRCSAAHGDGGDPDPGPRVSFEKRTPEEGTYAMYALIQSNRIIASAYTGGGAAEQRGGRLKPEDKVTFERLFSRERVTAYHADNRPPTAPGTTSPATCPEERRVCTPPPAGDSPAGPCACVSTPGGSPTLRYSVTFDRVGEAGFGSFTFGEQNSAITTEMLATLEKMRAEYFGR
jgi:hypothetical protein